MGGSSVIEHDAIVKESGDDLLRVAVRAGSACKGCHAEGYCNPSGQQEKIIDIRGSYLLKAGEKVTVLMRLKTGYTAVFLGYILPLIFLIITLVITSLLLLPEPLIALSSILVLALYYLVLYLLRERISRKFTFSIKP